MEIKDKFITTLNIFFMESQKSDFDYIKALEIFSDRLVEDLEQSKTPKEEHCDFCEDPENCEGVKCQPKTEDTGECKNCGGKGYNTVFTGIRISPDFIGDVEYNEKPKINKVPCRICKGTGVSKEATNEDSCDTLSSSENKEESMEDRFDEEFMDGKMSKLLLRDGNARLMKLVKLFIQSEISKAVAKERESIINKKHFEENMLDGDLVEDCGGAMLRASEVWEYLSLLNSKKGQE